MSNTIHHAEGDKRAQFGSKIGAILATVGSAVGLGNIWRFPYETGQNGGAAFLIIYIACVLILGIPVITAELLIGRATHKGIRQSVNMLAPGKHLSKLTLLLFVTPLVTMGYYSVVASWILSYLSMAVTGSLQSMPAGSYSALFESITADPYRSVMWVMVFLMLNFIILLGGIRKGIERLSDVLMPLFFAILIIFAVASLRTARAAEGLRFLFAPDWSVVTGETFISALGQAFMSVSIGLGILITYGSYYSDETPLIRTASTIAILDTVVAILAGVMIFPALFSFGGEVTAGPRLVFEVLPDIFRQMAGAYVWAVGFFLLLLFAAITSTVAMSEVCVTYLVEQYRMTRMKATSWVTFGIFCFGVMSALSFNTLQDAKLFDRTLFDLFEYATSNILIPLGGLLAAVFVGWVVKRQVVMKQLHDRQGETTIWSRLIYALIRYVAPICILMIFLHGIL